MGIRAERSGQTDEEVRPGRQVVLIISRDAVGAALVGALVETLGYLVRFLVPPESADVALRRERPAVAMVDCDDPTLLSPELIGRARMRGVSVLMFGSGDAVRRMHELAQVYDLHAVIMPASADHVAEGILRALG